MNSTKLMAILIIELMLFFPLAAAFSLSEPMVQVNANSAAINWTTPVPADSEIQYGKTTGKDLRKNGAELILYHNLILENLEEFTKYYYKVVSKDENGTLASYPAVGSGQELSFITPDLTPPPKVQSLVLVNATAYTVEMEWGHVEVIDFDRYEIFRDGELVKDITSTSYIDTELLPGMPYEYKVRAVDDYENSGDFSDIIFINTIGEDKTPPVISNIRLSVLSETGATIAWDTDENSNSKIYYSPDETLGEEESKSDLVKEHGISINGLVDGWHYYYKVESCDARGNCMESSVDDFVAGSDYEPPFIEANVPEYYNEVGLDFDVETEAYADVKVYVNDLISRSSNAGENGEVHFDNIILKSILPVNLVKVEAVDAAGNSASQEFNVYLDFEAPELVIQTNVSEVIKQGSFSIQGYVTEQSTVSFYVEQEPFSFSSPGKVNGLFLEKVEDGFIEFSWNKSTANDLDEYLIYREDVGLIGIAGTELFIDTNVIAGETYTYWVSALDYDCLEGEYSSELIVKTLEEQGFPKEFEGIGNAPVEDLEQVVPECRQKIPILQIETSGSFNEQLSLREGNNKLIIVAEDIYGNSVNVSYDSLYDSQPPVFNSINLGAISPSYNQQVRVSGNLSEPCLLEVYVNEEKVSTGETDENGIFNIDVKLNKENPKEDGSRDRGWDNEVKVVAIDRAGNTVEKVDQIEFLVCGSSNPLFSITPKNLAPSELVPRHLYEGMGFVTFELDLEWMGFGEEKSIRSYNIDFLDLSMDQIQNYDTDIISIGDFPTNQNPGDQSIAVQMSINKIDPTNNNDNNEKNWTLYEIEKNISKRHSGHCFTHSDLFSGGLDGIEGPGCIRVPLEVTINYDTEDYDGNDVIQAQKECIFVDVFIQPAVDVAGSLPKDLLQGMVDILDTFIETIDRVLEPLHTVSKYLMYSCLGMHAVHYISQGAEWFSCNSDILLVGQGALGISACAGCIVTEDGAVDCTGLSGDFVPARDSCESCVAAKLRTYNVEKAMHLVCDRVTCNSIPSFSTYANNQASYSFKSKESACVGFTEGPVEGNGPLTIEYGVEDKGDKQKNDPLDYNDATLIGAFGNDPCDICAVVPEATYCDEHTECCAIQYKKEWDSASLFTNEIKESACMAVNEPGEVYIESDVKEEACGSGMSKVFKGIRDFSLCEGEQQIERFEYQISSDDWLVMIKVKESEWTATPENGEDDGEDIWELALKSRNYNNLNLFDNEGKPISETEGEEVGEKFIYSPLKTNQAIIEGSLSGYPTVEDNELKGRLEDTGTLDIFIPDIYSQWNTVQRKGKGSGDLQPSISVVEYTKSICTNVVSAQNDETHISLGDVNWPAYFYPDYDEGSPLNQRRYVQNANGEYGIEGVDFIGQDLPASFVNFICEGYQPKESHILDPRSGLFKAMEAVCIPAIEKYLEQTRMIMSTMQGCINQILVTGEGSAGYCQQFLSMYVCDLMYYTLSCVKKMVPADSGSRGYAPGIAGFGQYMLSSIQETKQGIENRYGADSKLSTLLNGKQLFNSACMVMFGADIAFDFDAMIDMSVDMPIEPMADLSGNTRRFNGVNPNGYVDYIYTLYPLLITTQDVNYRIMLVCSDSYTCNPDYGFENGQCDCAGLGEQSTLIEGGRLEAGDVFGDDGDEELLKRVNSKYRYDKVVLEYDYLVGAEGRVGEQGNKVIDSVESEISLVGGYEPSYCFLRTHPTIEFRCNTAADNGAKARFINPVIDEENEVIEINDDDEHIIYLGENFINENLGSDIKFHVEQLEQDDYGNDLPVYIVATLRNNQNVDIKIEEQRINNLEVIQYDEDTNPFSYILRENYFESVDVDNCFKGNEFTWCVKGSNPDELDEELKIIKFDTPGASGTNGWSWNAGSDSVLYFAYNDGWKFFETSANGWDEDGEPCIEDGRFVSYTEGEYDIKVELPAGYNANRNNDIKFMGKESGAESLHKYKFDLILELYNSNEDETRNENNLVMYNGIGQKFTYEFDVVNTKRPSCSEDYPEECDTEDDCGKAHGSWSSDDDGVGECHRKSEASSSSEGSDGTSGAGGSSTDEEQGDLDGLPESFVSGSGNVILNPLAVADDEDIINKLIMIPLPSQTGLFPFPLQLVNLKEGKTLTFDLPPDFEPGEYQVSFVHLGDYDFTFEDVIYGWDGSSVLLLGKTFKSYETSTENLKTLITALINGENIEDLDLTQAQPSDENSEEIINLVEGQIELTIKSNYDYTSLGRITLIPQDISGSTFNNGIVEEGEICDFDSEGNAIIMDGLITTGRSLETHGTKDDLTLNGAVSNTAYDETFCENVDNCGKLYWNLDEGKCENEGKSYSPRISCADNQGEDKMRFYPFELIVDNQGNILTNIIEVGLYTPATSNEQEYTTFNFNQQTIDHSGDCGDRGKTFRVYNFNQNP